MQASARELKQLTQEEVFDLGVRAQTDSEALTSLTVGFAEALLDIAKYGQKIEQIEREHRRVLELYRRLVARLYGKKSETVDPNQLLLFIKEAFEGEVSKMDCSAPDAPPKPRQKKKPGHGRDHFPDHLPRKRFEIEPKKDDCVCEGCNSALHRFGEEVTERGHLIPGSWVVNQYVRGKWACKKGCSGVVTADLPKTLVDKSRFEPSVAIGAAISKYADHVPLERQAEIHSRVGVDIAPSTLGDAVQNLAELHAQTIDQMRVETLSEPTIHADDTPVKTLIENPAVKEAAISNEKPTPKQKIITEGRVWVYLAMTGKVFYDFTLGKSEKGPAAVLKDFHGKAVVDGAPNFNAGLRAGGATRCGCWSHVRRKFFESLGNMPKPAASMLI
jgi:transposase